MIPKREDDAKGLPLTSSPDQIIIEEKALQSGQPIKRYSKGKLLGKVCPY